MLNNDLANQTIAPSAWKKSSFSGAGSGSDCVMVAPLEGGVAMHDSKDPSVGELRVHEGAMAAFLNGVRGGSL